MAFLLAILACTSAPGGTGTAGAPAPPQDTGQAACPPDLDWERVAAPLLLGQCGACHSSRLQGEARWGAPEEVDLDTLDGARLHGEAALARMSSGTMPPGGGVSAGELERFSRWLDCGAPGEPLAWLELEPLPTVVSALELELEILAAPEEPGLLALEERDILEASLWSRELWQVEGDGAALVERARYDAEGAPLYVDRWQPPLQLLPASEDQEQRTRRTREHADGSSEDWEEGWAASVGLAEEIDYLLDLDPDPQQVRWTSDSGDEVGLYLSSTWGITRRWVQEEGLDPAGDRVRWLHLTDQPPPDPAGTGLVEGRRMVSRVLGEVLP